MTTPAPPFAGQTVFYQAKRGEVPAVVVSVYPWTIGLPIACDLFIMDGSGLGTHIQSDDSDTPAFGTWHSQANNVSPFGPVSEWIVVKVAAGPFRMVANLPPNLYTNEGAAEEVELLLPLVAWPGQVFPAYVQNAHGIKVRAGAGTTIRVGGSVSAPGGYAESFLPGSSLRVAAINATEWVGVATLVQWDVE